jgi:Zn-dependent protease with chaperone function
MFFNLRHLRHFEFEAFDEFMEIEGIYLDGRSAQRQRVRVQATPQGLWMINGDGERICWPWEEIRQSRNFYGDHQIRLERGKNPPEMLLVPGASFLQRAGEMAPERVRSFRRPKSRRNWAVVGLLSALGVIGAVVPLYFWGIPALASQIAAHVPVSWERKMGEEVLKHLAPPEKQCSDPVRAGRIQEVLSTLTTSLPASPYTFRVIVVNHSMVNAFALPGGTIVLCQGLLEKTGTAEELAGVLAHEVQHILHRHATRAILQQASTHLLLAALTGDAGSMGFGLEGAQAIGMLRYSRQYEEEADREGMKLLIRSGIHPQGMVSFFETMQKESEPSLQLPTYFSTHPNLEDRVQRLSKLARDSEFAAVKLLRGYNWKDMHAFCGEENGRR